MSRGTKRSSHEAFGGSSRSPETAQDLLKKHRASVAKRHNVNHDSIDFDDGPDSAMPSSRELGPESQRKMVSSSSLTAPHHHQIRQGKPDVKSLAKSHLITRQKLPIWSHQDAIRSALRTHNVLLLVGETGSGKSTQVPQFLLGEKWCRRRTVTVSEPTAGPDATSGAGEKASRQQTATVELGGCIAITQPRRVAATSLARRVAEEMGTPLGGNRGEVGYSVRFDNQTGPKTRIKFLTEGMLLQELLRDPGLRGYSVVVVDEVHERGIDVDLCLGFLRSLCDGRSEVVRTYRGGVPLKVVVMSATAEMQVLNGFFTNQDGERIQSQAKHDTNGAGRNEKDAEDDFAGFSSNEDEAKETKTKKNLMEKAVNRTTLPTGSSSPQVTTLNIPGRLFPVEVNYLATPTSDIISAALDRIIHIHVHSPLPGDILVFLPGQESIESLLSLLKSYAATLNTPEATNSRPTTNKSTATSNETQPNSKSNNTATKPTLGPRLPDLLPLPLHASLPAHLQQLAFLPAPTPFTRKVILATNIAETSLTLPGILYVIDSGLCKQRFYRPSLGMESLVVKEISKSSAKQRAGRAGREKKGGKVWRLFTERDYEGLETVAEEEVRRGDLRGVVLALRGRRVKGDGFGDGKDDDDDGDAEVDGLGERDRWKWVTKPKRKAWRAALLGLMQVGALDVRTGNITDIGRELSLLPLPVPLGRCLLSSVTFGVVQQIIDIVSALSVEGVFLNLGHGERTTTSGQNDGANDAEDEEENLDPRIKLRQRLYRREGDHLTLLATVQAYVTENSDRKRWCSERGISHRAMQGAMDVRKQLMGIMERKVKERNSSSIADDSVGSSRKKQTKVQQPSSTTDEDDGTSNVTTTAAAAAAATTHPATDPESESESETTRRILTCLLTGLHPNVAMLSTVSSSSSSSSKTANNNHGTKSAAGRGGPPAQYLTLHTNQPIAIHPSSVLFGRRVEAIVSSEVVFTTKSYARCVSAVEMGWVGVAQGVAMGG